MDDKNIKKKERVLNILFETFNNSEDAEQKNDFIAWELNTILEFLDRKGLTDECAEFTAKRFTKLIDEHKEEILNAIKNAAAEGGDETAAAVDRVA